LLVLADHCSVSIAELCAEITQGVIIELKLALKQAIRDAPPALEHSDRVIEALLKSHRSPSLCLRGAERTVWE
jgi:hypothetical protein